MNKARYKIYKNHQLFEIAMNYKLIDAEKYLVRLDLREVLANKCNEDIEERPIDEVLKRINGSGHA